MKEVTNFLKQAMWAEQRKKANDLNIKCAKMTNYLKTNKITGSCFVLHDSISLEVSEKDYKEHEQEILKILNYN